MYCKSKKLETFVVYLLVLFVGICLLSFFACPVLADEYIRSFSSEIQIYEDGAIRVTETIIANCEGKNIRHGIYREIPIKYNKGLGLVLDSHFNLLSVEIDGKRASYHTKINGFNIRIYMGSSRQYISKGMHEFKLSYEMEGMLSFFKDFDELYWNVTGNEWNFAIHKASAIITLPRPAGFVRYAIYTGRKGAKGKMARLVSKDDESIEFETTDILLPGEGFTVAVAWPKGVVIEPSSTERLMALVRDNKFFMLGIFFAVGAFCYYLFAWYKVGRDPDIGPVVPRFNPPEGLSPQAARFIRKMGWDDKNLAVTLVNLAVKGAVKLEEKPKYVVVKKEKPPFREPLDKTEEEFMWAFFGPYWDISLKRSEAENITAGIESLKKSMSRKYERVYFLANMKYMIPGFLLSFCGILCLGLAGQDLFGGLFISFWLFTWSTITAGLLIGAIKAAKAGSYKSLPIAIIFNFGTLVGCFIYSMFISVPALVLFISILVMNALFFYLMKAPTMKGSKVIAELEGFRMFLKTAEAKRLEVLTPPDKLPELFERYLPWAMALDVENTWGRRFEQIMKELGQEHVHTPSWYSGSHISSYSALSTGISSSVYSSLTAATAPSSSGSGGGGGAGGGGGGGGGGGW